jgi:hypothetical protein
MISTFDTQRKQKFFCCKQLNTRRRQVLFLIYFQINKKQTHMCRLLFLNQCKNQEEIFMLSFQNDKQKFKVMNTKHVWKINLVVISIIKPRKNWNLHIDLELNFHLSGTWNEILVVILFIIAHGLFIFRAYGRLDTQYIFRWLRKRLWNSFFSHKNHIFDGYKSARLNVSKPVRSKQTEIDKNVDKKMF